MVLVEAGFSPELRVQQLMPLYRRPVRLLTEFSNPLFSPAEITAPTFSSPHALSSLG